jgi:hypothetical protein
MSEIKVNIGFAHSHEEYVNVTRPERVEQNSVWNELLYLWITTTSSVGWEPVTQTF